jgi:hypothetical protein
LHLVAGAGVLQGYEGRGEYRPEQRPDDRSGRRRVEDVRVGAVQRLSQPGFGQEVAAQGSCLRRRDGQD